MNPPDTPDPFIILPNAIYPISWLRERLHGVIELPTLLDRTGLRAKRKFRDAILGSELLEALTRVEPYAESGHPAAQALEARGRVGRPRQSGKVMLPKGRGNGAWTRLTSKPFEP